MNCWGQVDVEIIAVLGQICKENSLHRCGRSTEASSKDFVGQDDKSSKLECLWGAVPRIWDLPQFA